MKRTRDSHDRRVKQKTRNRFDIKGCRHDDDAQIAASEPCLPGERKPEIGVDTAFVELVQDDRCEIRKERILLKARGENPFGHDEQPRVTRKALFETNLPADVTPQRPTTLVGDPSSNGTRCHTPRLQEDDETLVNERRWDTGGLARAG